MNNYPDSSIFTIQVKQQLNKVGDISEPTFKDSDEFINLIDIANKVGEQCTKNDKPSENQVMNLVTELRTLSKEPERGRILLYRTFLMYATSKDKNLKPIRDVLDPWFDKMKKMESIRKGFGSFVSFVEAIVASYRYNLSLQPGDRHERGKNG